MKFVEKASGWLFAIGLAVALVLMFNYLDVLILMGFRNSGIDTRVYKGIYTTVAAVANIVFIGLLIRPCSVQMRMSEEWQSAVSCFWWT